MIFFLHNSIPSQLLIHLIKYFSYIVLILQKYLPVQKYSPVQKNIYEFFTLFCRQTILSGKQADLNFRIRKRVLTISCQAIYIIYNQISLILKKILFDMFASMYIFQLSCF